MSIDLIVPFDGAKFSDSFVRTVDPMNITTQPMPVGGLAWGAGPIGGVGSGAIHCVAGTARTAGSGTAVMIAFTAPAAQDLSIFAEFSVITAVETVGLAFAVQNVNNFYYVRASATGWRVFRYNSATSTHAEVAQTVHTSVTPASGARVVVEKVRDAVKVFVNGVLSLSLLIDADMITRDRFGMVLTGLDTSSVADIAGYPKS